MAGSKFNIRKATEQDAGALSEFRLALFQELGEGPAASEVAKFLADCTCAIAKGIREGYSLSWLAEDPLGNCVSTMVMNVFQRLPSPRLRGTIEGYILNVYVSPGSRRQGVASGLLKAAVEHASAAGFARIRLHATEEGRGVYSALGFRGRVDEMELVLGESP